MLTLTLFPIALAHALLIRADRWIMRQPTGRPVVTVTVQPALTAVQLRRKARSAGITRAGNRPIHLARKADLLKALGI